MMEEDESEKGVEVVEVSLRGGGPRGRTTVKRLKNWWREGKNRMQKGGE